MLEQINKLHQYMKKNQLQSFLIIVVLILIIYYAYKYYKKEYFGEEIGTGAIISYSSLCIVFMIIPYLILYYIVKYASKNAIKETSQLSQLSQSKS
jgi:hypothetical protein